MPRAPTYAQARDHLLTVLQLNGWDVARTDRSGKKLKVPHATKGRARVYFKSQSMHVDCGPPFSLNAARSTHDDPRELAELVGDDSVVADKMSRTLEIWCLRDNPIKDMPGGSVTGCIKMHADKDDPGAYCAAIADRIEPGWRHKGRKKKRKKNPTAFGIRPRTVVSRAASGIEAEEVADWVRTDEHGTWEKQAKELLETPGLEEKARDAGMGEDEVVEEAATILRLRALSAAESLYRRGQSLHSRRRNPGSTVDLVRKLKF